MAQSEPVITVLAASSLAALVAGFGSLPFAFGRRVPLSWVGASYAIASGLMLGAGYLLMTEGLNRAPLLVVIGVGLGVTYTYGSQYYAGIHELDTDPDSTYDVLYGYKIILQNTLHSASEGVAIGVCMVISLEFGIFLALALAVHNIGEGMALTAVLRGRGMSVGEAAGLCVVSRVPQVLLAVVAFAVSPALGRSFSVALGFAAGAMLFLTLTELLPASYQRSEKLHIAFLVSASAGAVVFLEGVLL